MEYEVNCVYYSKILNHTVVYLAYAIVDERCHHKTLSLTGKRHIFRYDDGCMQSFVKIGPAYLTDLELKLWESVWR